MQVDRFSVTMDPELGQAVREAAARSGLSVSRWLGDAAADHLRNQLLGAALNAWEAEAGAFTDGELADAARVLGARPRTRRAAKAG
jgi:predicted transcriptional regulator